MTYREKAEDFLRLLEAYKNDVNAREVVEFYFSCEPEDIIDLCRRLIRDENALQKIVSLGRDHAYLEKTAERDPYQGYEMANVARVALAATQASAAQEGKE